MFLNVFTSLEYIDVSVINLSLFLTSGLPGSGTISIISKIFHEPCVAKSSFLQIAVPMITTFLVAMVSETLSSVTSIDVTISFSSSSTVSIIDQLAGDTK
ncbi:hypothetical protein OGAPHI_005904 [Ogataea philodendri]|uniref:Uncharacterized protein n=1 Tax=Ogataea philodendri TaxID=1378263 RepID=A0A9P8T0R0_9ASCO|nr:uncharacterized protein OGAPHI_005904 [Ogataea philodendri]KAH3661726.1 hypothetical protein OGAPHI_005904 [Ogataea philodendri]